MGGVPARVLLAEDDKEMRSLIATALRRDGYDVFEARDGAKLLDLIGAAIATRVDPAVPEIIISDIRMPGYTGLEVLGGLRRDDWETPVILITAFGDRETHMEAYRLGADVVLNKPLDMDDLRMAVKALVAMRT
jgi:DNA-binding response OmpR family regulator